MKYIVFDGADVTKMLDFGPFHRTSSLPQTAFTMTSDFPIEDLVMELEEVETDYASIRALREAATEFETYITNNKDMIPNYAERRRYGERVSTGFVESTVNTVVGKRFGKRQQMR